MDTICVLMGRAKLREITAALIAAGRDEATPAACVEWATTPRERLATGTLGDIADQMDRAGLKAPVVTVIGDVARFVNSEGHARQRDDL
jgi:uroporphyrinogen III methyltransferase/synthase